MAVVEIVDFVRKMPIPPKLRKTGKWFLTFGGHWRPDVLVNSKYQRRFERPAGVTICLLLSRCRTGSTALIRTICEDPRAMAYSEVFSATLPYSYQHYLADRLAKDAEARTAFVMEGPLFGYRKYIEHLTACALRRKPELRLLVFEIKLESLYVFAKRWTEPSLGLTSSEILNLGLDIADKVLFLKRRDILERHCSKRMAEATGVYHSSSGSQERILADRPMPKTTENVAQMMEIFEREIAFDGALLAHLKRSRPDFELIEYEKAYRGGRFTPEFLARFSEIFSGMSLREPALRKVRSRSAKDMLVNYDAVRAAMKNSPALAAALEESA